ncbi:MAG: FHA domain-containing protein, partial [Steroidobacteraceae bacterium]
LDALRVQLETQQSAEQELRAQVEARTREDAAMQEKLTAAEQKLTDRDEMLRMVRDELTKSQQHTQEVEADLLAAEDAIGRHEAELRAKVAQAEETARETAAARAQVAETRAALEERETKIRSLEAETKKSIAALDNIQQSMQRLDPLAHSAADLVAEGATRLLIRKDGDSEVVHVLGRRTTVGREPDNDLQIDARFISRHHAVILCGPVYTVIEDLNSTNGVMVNNHLVTRHTLKDGDTVVIGKTIFRFAVRPAAARN